MTTTRWALLASVLIGTIALSGCHKEQDGEPDDASASQVQQKPDDPSKDPGKTSVPRTDGEYVPGAVKELDADSETAARQFALAFYDWDSRNWDTDNPTGREMIGDEAISLMTNDLDKGFDSDGLVPLGVPNDFNAPDFRSNSSYVETMRLKAYADDHTLSETFALWNVDVTLNIISADEEQKDDGITRSSRMTLPVLLTMERKKKSGPWLVSDISMARSW